MHLVNYLPNRRLYGSYLIYTYDTRRVTPIELYVHLIHSQLVLQGRFLYFRPHKTFPIVHEYCHRHTPMFVHFETTRTYDTRRRTPRSRDNLLMQMDAMMLRMLTQSFLSLVLLNFFPNTRLYRRIVIRTYDIHHMRARCSMAGLLAHNSHIIVHYTSRPDTL